MSLRRVVRAGRRVRQSFTHFENGPQLLWSAARSKEMTFRTRTGLTLHTPNVGGARFPVYEINADDVYRMSEVLTGIGADPVVVDIGAHVGSFSTAVCAARSDAVVHAFEASPATADWLERNVTANNLQDRLIVHRRAVTGHDGTLEMIDNGLASAHNGLTAPDGLGTVVSVPCIDFAGIHAATGGRITVVKSDAEGAEYDFILSSDPLHWSTVQRVVMEYHPVAGHTFEELVDFLSATGISLIGNEPADRPGLGNAWFARTETVTA